jgi:phosphate uptake regulator
MKRKVIQLAGKTLVVSLPSKWARSLGINKGDEIDVLEDKHGLLIATEGTDVINEKEINLSELKGMLNRYIGALYKAGYDRIKVTFENAEQLNIINNTIRRSCIGFEIIEEGKNFVLIERLSKSEADEFDKVLRRAFLFLLGVAEDSIVAIEQKDDEELKNIILRDDNINRFTDFCRRILNKGKYKGDKRVAPLYYITEQLEKVGDIYRDLCKHHINNPSSIKKETSELYRQVNSFLRNFYELFYDFKLNKLEDFGTKRTKLKKQIVNAIESKQDRELLYFLKNISETVFEMNSALLASQV